jgi:hypothetical protein
MFKYYNAHPRKLSVTDCTKRSISLTTGIPYQAVAKGLNDYKKVTGVKLFYNNPNPQGYMENVLGFSRRLIDKKPDGSRITVVEFANSHPCGRYVLSISGHWTACIDGIVYDTWDCTGKEALAYYEITRFVRTKIEKKYCFTVKRELGNHVFITVYDGNGMYATKPFTREASRGYIESLYERGFFNFDEMGEYI